MPKPVSPTSTQLTAFQSRIGVQFRDPDLLIEALTHASYVNEHPNDGARDNERLEFLGDTIIGFTAADMIFSLLPDISEGRMTQIRSMLVRDTTLAAFAEELEIGALMRFGRGLQGDALTPGVLGSAFEALTAAIYIDQGLNVVRTFLAPRLQTRIEPIAADERLNVKDAKSRLQEWTMQQRRGLPTYTVVSMLGAEHQPEFVVEVLIEGVAVATGAGTSKQAAQQSAAKMALQRLEAG